MIDRTVPLGQIYCQKL